MIGHFVGTGAEFSVVVACNALVGYISQPNKGNYQDTNTTMIITDSTINTALCNAIGFAVHEFLVEPMVDGIIYGSMAGGLEALSGDFDWWRILPAATASFAGNIFLNQCGIENIVVKGAVGVLGGMLGTTIYDYMLTPTN